MPDLQVLFDQSASAMRTAGYWSTRTARLMIGVPDYETYVAHRRANHPDQPIMTYVEFFRELSERRRSCRAPAAHQHSRSGWPKSCRRTLAAAP